MSDKEYQEMVKLYLRLKYLIRKYDEYFDYTTKTEDEPIMIPPDVYDEICDALGEDKIILMGIT